MTAIRDMSYRSGASLFIPSNGSYQRVLPIPTPKLKSLAVCINHNHYLNVLVN